MSRLEPRTWPADPHAYGPRAERRGFIYHAFVPDPIADRPISLDGALASAVSLAERRVDALNRNPPAVGSLEVLARRLLRAESVASSRIEGLELSQRRLARAEAQGTDARDETARSVLGNVRAMEAAVALGASSRPLKLADVLEIHRVLMIETRTPKIAGKLRTVQNWIGGNAFNPGGADFVPPPAEEVEPLTQDLVQFMNRTDLPPVVQAGVAHAQSETIHPFADGNGRVGRALIHVVLRRRGLAPRYVPPVSLVLAADSKSYVAGLTRFREERIDEWLRLFAGAVDRAATEADELAKRLAALQDRWRERAGQPRRESAADRLIDQLPARPIVTLATVGEITSRSKQAANEAIAKLAESGVLKAMTLGKRNRAWEAPELFDLIDDFERLLATPVGSATAERPAPRRRS